MDQHERRAMLEEEVEALSQCIEERGYWVEGSSGQPVLNPALSARRACLEALRKLDVSKIEDASDELEEFLGENNQRRKANCFC